MNFEYNIQEKDGVNVIAIKGNLIDKNQAENLMEEINEQVLEGYNRFVIDMTDFKYMNSTGLNVLVHILTKARKSGGEAVICCMPDKIRELLVITKLNTVFTITEDLDKAILQFNAAN
jgi:anti-sigma B factor antagonist